jgi:hypothetical protein
MMMMIVVLALAVFLGAAEVSTRWLAPTTPTHLPTFSCWLAENERAIA